MSVSRLADDELRAYLEAGHSQADAARHFDVQRTRDSSAAQTMRHLTSRLVALERANEVVEEKLSSMI
jgi:hypothetical protein